MATSVESPSPAPLKQGSSQSLMGPSSPAIFSPSSDKRFWSTLRNRIDTLLENRTAASDQSLTGTGTSRLREDSMLLLRGFDSVAQTLSQLSDNIENALQGAKELAGPPTLTEIVHSTLEKAKFQENLSNEESNEEQEEEDKEGGNRGLKRKLDPPKSCEDQREDSQEVKESKNPHGLEKIKKAKNMAITMATKAASMARELKSIRSDLSFVQERCALLEEENRRLRDGLAKGIRLDEDDLIRLQLEALLAEKSRLANENANLTRENQCLHQLVEYHQLTSHDLSASCENLVRGMCLDFSSPEAADAGNLDTPKMTSKMGSSKALDKCFEEDEEEEE